MSGGWVDALAWQLRALRGEMALVSAMDLLQNVDRPIHIRGHAYAHALPVDGFSFDDVLDLTDEQRAALRMAGHRIRPGHRHVIARRSAVLADQLKDAEPYAWSDDTIAAVAAASRTLSPSTAVLHPSQMPPTRVGWFWFDHMAPLTVDRYRVCGLLWAILGDGVSVSAFIRADDDGTTVNGLSLAWPYGESAERQLERLDPDDLPAESKDDAFATAQAEAIEILTFTAAAFAWLDQRILVTSDGHIERHERKRAERELDRPVSGVRVVQLRRALTVPHDGESHAVDWSHRWIVRGHWRNQAYRDDHRLIFINPHVKGPDDKPLRVPDRTVYEVSR